MKFDTREDHSEKVFKLFLDWLETETTDCLERSHGNPETLKACLFLFANQANEAHLDEVIIFQTLGRCLGRAGYNEHEESFALDLYEPIHALAIQVHNNA